MSSRVIRLTASHNTRDLGGLRTDDGRVVRRGRLIRAEFTDMVAGEDVDLLVRRIGLRTVLDLRRDDERVHASVAWDRHGVAHVSRPFGLKGRPAIAAGDRADVYLGYMESDPATFVGAVATIADPANHPLMFHCAAGKDRTGVLSAVVLDLLGVSRDAIARDYAMSADGIARIIDRLRRQPPYRDALAGTTLADHLPAQEAILGFLDTMDERHGGCARWLAAHGLDAAAIDQFRAAMLDPG